MHESICPASAYSRNAERVQFASAHCWTRFQLMGSAFLGSSACLRSLAKANATPVLPMQASIVIVKAFVAHLEITGKKVAQRIKLFAIKPQEAINFASLSAEKEGEQLQ